MWPAVKGVSASRVGLVSPSALRCCGGAIGCAILAPAPDTCPSPRSSTSSTVETSSSRIRSPLRPHAHQLATRHGRLSASAIMLASALGATRVGAFNVGQHRAHTAAPSKTACVRCSVARAAAAPRAAYTQPTWAQRMRASVDVRATGADVVGETKQEEEEEEEDGMDESRAREFSLPPPASSVRRHCQRPTLQPDTHSCDSVQLNAQFAVARPSRHGRSCFQPMPMWGAWLKVAWGLAMGLARPMGFMEGIATADDARQRAKLPTLGRPVPPARSLCVHRELKAACTPMHSSVCSDGCRCGSRPPIIGTARRVPS